MASAKYHVTDAGPKPCNASKRACRYGGDRHFEDRAEAKVFYEKELEREAGGTSKAVSRRKGTPQAEAAPPAPKASPSAAALAKDYGTLVAHRWAEDPSTVEDAYGQRFDSVAEVRAAAKQEYHELGEASTYHGDLTALEGKPAVEVRGLISNDYNPRRAQELSPAAVKVTTASEAALAQAQAESDAARLTWDNAREFARDYPFASLEDRRKAMEDTNALFEAYRGKQALVEDALARRRAQAEADAAAGFSTDPKLVDTGSYRLSLREVATSPTTTALAFAGEPRRPYAPKLSLAPGDGAGSVPPQFLVKPSAPGAVSPADTRRVAAHLRQGAETARVLQEAYQGPSQGRVDGVPAITPEALHRLPTGVPEAAAPSAPLKPQEGPVRAVRGERRGERLRVTEVTLGDRSFTVALSKLGSTMEPQVTEQGKPRNRSKVAFTPGGGVTVSPVASDFVTPQEALTKADELDQAAAVGEALSSFVARFTRREAKNF